MTLRLSRAAAQVVAGGHEAAAEAIDGTVHSAPGEVDAGYGAAYVSQVLAAVSQTAGEIAVVNAAVAALVREAVAEIGSTDEEVAARLDALKADVR